MGNTWLNCSSGNQESQCNRRSDLSSQSDTSSGKREADNPVWENLAPNVWRDAIYSKEAETNCMGRLFASQVDLYK